MNKWDPEKLQEFIENIETVNAQKQRDFVVPDHLKQSFGENVSTYNEFGKFSLRNRILKSWANCNFYLQRIAQIIKNPIYHGTGTDVVIVQAYIIMYNLFLSINS
jgi:hypothetical protein